MNNRKSSFTQTALDYANRALDKKNNKRFGKWIKLAAKRFLNDLKRAKKKRATFCYSEYHAENACEFAELLPHIEGKWDSPTIRLEDFQVFLFCNLFGFRKPDGTRRFTTALLAVARKNGKSTIAAPIALYCQVREGEEGPQVISGATTGAQARIVFGYAKRMVEKTSAMREAFGLEPFANAIASYCNGGTFKPVNSKASTQDGLNPSCVVLDEIHAHKNSDLLNVLRSAAGARRNPLFLFVTTEGYESPGPWHELRHFAKQVLENVVEADHFLAIYYALDDDDKDFDEEAWVKSNPLLEANDILLTEIRKEAIEAKAMPGKMAEFRIKRLNRQSATSRGWINFDNWKRCAKPVDLEYLKKFPCYGGLDLSSTSDLTSFRLVWYIDGVWYTHGKRWVPKEKVDDRTSKGAVPYNAWVEAGYMSVTEGNVINHQTIKQEIINLHNEFQIEEIGYDTWNASQISVELENEGVRMKPFIQGTKSFHPAMQTFEAAYMSGNFHYGIDPVLTWNASNIITRTDANMNMAPDKKRSPDKIDDMVALLIAIGTANSSEVVTLTGDLDFM